MVEILASGESNPEISEETIKLAKRFRQ